MKQPQLVTESDEYVKKEVQLKKVGRNRAHPK